MPGVATFVAVVIFVALSEHCEDSLENVEVVRRERERVDVRHLGRWVVLRLEVRCC